MIDLHCHLLPYVDDGAHDLEEAEKLLALEAEQGVTALCVTAHLREEMFGTPDEELHRQYERLKPMAAAKGLTLHLSREYHWDGLTLEKLRSGQVLPIGEKGMLAEFSSAHSAEQIFHAAGEIRRYGYTPLIAHVERCPAIGPEQAAALRDEGALIQVNADAVLGYDGHFMKKLVWLLLKAGAVDVIASDAHDSELRPPRMKECFTRIAKKLGRETAERLMRTNPARILGGRSRGVENE